MAIDNAKDERQRVRAASRGVGEWGTHGSAFDHERYALATDSRRRCPYCPGRGMSKPRQTHLGVANGVTLMAGCEWHVSQWVRDPRLPRMTMEEE